MPLFSIIIAVYNDWTALASCLHSLTLQANGPDFEVIAVDDGSAKSAPDEIRQWADRLPLTIVKKPHAGISCARNHGIRASGGSILLFVDADCRLEAGCLGALEATITASPQHNCFQLHLVGDGPGIVGKAEKLRLMTLQNHLLQASGCIRYLNTAGFAIRRARVNIDEGLFDPIAKRAEDTLLLANLIEGGELPFYASNALIRHVVSLSVTECLRKDAHSANLERRAYDIIASKGVGIRMSNGDRLRMLSSTWAASGQHSIGRSAWFLLMAKQALRLIVRLLADLFRIRTPLDVPVDSN